jgi:glycine reductase complex component B subunit gamma
VPNTRQAQSIWFKPFKKFKPFHGFNEEMIAMTTIVHVVNQFFAGLGGEDMAGMPVGVIDGSAGAARGLQLQLGEEAKIACTIYCGDNYFHEQKEDAVKAILDAVRSAPPEVLVAGPAFNSGRYGVSCVEVCDAIANTLGISCVTAMHEENPGIDTYRDLANSQVYCLPTAETAAGMTDALKRLAKFAMRLAHDETVGPAQREGYIPRGIRRLEQADRPGAERAIEMLLKKIKNEPFASELPMEVWDDAPPAPPLTQVKDRRLALVTTSGVVPWGNPDRFKTYRNTHWQKYNIAELKELEPGKWETVHGGYNIAYMNQNPHYGVPLDALRSLESEGAIGPGKLYPAYYVIPGNQGSPAVMRRVGQEIAADLKKDAVEGVLFVAT